MAGAHSSEEFESLWSSLPWSEWRSFSDFPFQTAGPSSTSQPSTSEVSSSTSAAPTSSASEPAGSTVTSETKTAAIIGGVSGGLAAVVIITVVILCIRRNWLSCVQCRRQTHKKLPDDLENGKSKRRGKGTRDSPPNVFGVERPWSADGPANHSRTMDTNDPKGSGKRVAPVTESASAPAVSDQRVQKDNTMGQIQSEPVSQSPPPPEPQGTFRDPSMEHVVCSPSGNLITSGPPIREIASVVQEMENLRSRMAELVNRRGDDDDTVTDRNSIVVTLAPTVDDDHQSAPPAYSDIGKC